MRRLLNRIEVMANTGSGGQRTWLALVIAALLGFQLASYKYGHGDPSRLAIWTGLLLNNVLFLFAHRLLRVVLFISGTTLFTVGIVMMLNTLLR